MCRWLAYSGSALGATIPNGDGFGVGWYADGAIPGVFRAVGPAWGDRNLRELAGHVSSPLFLAHIRASTGLERSSGWPASSRPPRAGTASRCRCR